MQECSEAIVRLLDAAFARIWTLDESGAVLELQASGGKAYLQDRDTNFARRWRESAFVPIITPSLTQLQVELQKHAAA